MSEKVTIAFDEKALEILNNTHIELRNAAVNIAVKMLAKDPMYKKYFCIKCDEVEVDDAVDLDNLGNKQTVSATGNAGSVTPQAVKAWDDF